MTAQTINKTELLDQVQQLSPREQIEFAEQILAGLTQQWPRQQPTKLAKRRSQTIRSLRGIWAGKGFEKIINLDQELKTARIELSEAILTRDF